jgi:hypothetical protein
MFRDELTAFHSVPCVIAVKKELLSDASNNNEFARVDVTQHFYPFGFSLY